MIDRIGVVAWRELVNAVWTRAFLMVVLLPLLILGLPAAVSAGIIGVVGVVGSMQDDPAQVERRGPRVVYVHDGTGLLELPESVEADDHEYEIRVLDAEEAAELRTHLADRKRSLLVEVSADALSPEEEGYTVWYAKVSDRDEARDVARAARAWIRVARFAEEGMESDRVRELWRVDGNSSRIEEVTTVDAALGVMADGYPLITLVVLYLVASVAGQGLLTSTVEEKSSRMAELLLSSVSPTELMLGKLSGQLAAGLLLALSWMVPLLAVFAVTSAAVMLDPLRLFAMALFFVSGVLSITALIGAVGSAVNEVREANALVQPVGMLIFGIVGVGGIGALLPDSTAAVVLTLLPPFNTFATVGRLASDTPPPAWQVLISLVLSYATAVAAVWLAARIFRIGLLLRGPPPDVRTFLRWVWSSGG